MTTTVGDLSSHSAIPEPESSRVIRPRRTWPGSRATVGGLLVAIAAIGLFAAFQNAGAGPDVRYVVARNAVAPGTVLTADHLGTQAMELPDSLAARSFTLAEHVDLVGAVTTQAIAAGELVQLSDLRVGTGQQVVAEHELSFSVESDRAVSGTLRAGERVDIIATIGSGPDAPTEVVGRDVLVLSVHRSDEAGLGGARQVVTVALHDDAAAVAVAAAVDKGTVTLVRANGR